MYDGYFAIVTGIAEGEHVKTEKKERIIRKQKSLAILTRNRKINKINLIILGAGLLLVVLDQNAVGYILIWPGIAIFIYTQISSINARRT